LANFPKRWNGARVWDPPPTRVVVSDASDVGWGAIVSQGTARAPVSRANGPGMAAGSTSWSVRLGAQLAVRAALPLLKDQVVEVVVDNSRHILWSQELGLLKCSIDEVVEEVALGLKSSRHHIHPGLVKPEANAGDACRRFKRDGEWILDARVFDLP